MQSTSASDSEDLIASIENLNLVLHADVHRPWTFRDAFAQASKKPFDTLLPEKERLHILKDVSFEIRRGERIGLLGVNGTGKTSLCRCIAGIYGATSGKVRTNGRVQAVFDTAIGILPELTGRENAKLLANFMYPDCIDQHEQMIESALEFSELGRFTDVPFKFYSNGMQTRLCLSLISCKPMDLVILDEVFDGADMFFKEKIAERVQTMIEKSGATIFVSHSPEQISRVCNRLIVLNHGTVGFDGTVREGLEFYRNLRPAH